MSFKCFFNGFLDNDDVLNCNEYVYHPCSFHIPVWLTDVFVDVFRPVCPSRCCKGREPEAEVGEPGPGSVH